MPHIQPSEPVRHSVIHGVQYASQPDIHLQCGPWIQPAWNQPPVRPSDAYLGEVTRDNRVWYTFEDSRVSCPECLRVMKEKATR